VGSACRTVNSIHQGNADVILPLRRRSQFLIRGDPMHRIGFGRENANNAQSTRRIRHMDLVADLAGNLDYSIIDHHRLFLSRLYIAVSWFECNAPYGSADFAAPASMWWQRAHAVLLSIDSTTIGPRSAKPKPSQPIDVGMIVDSIFFHVWLSLIDRDGAAERRDRIRG
jgi:hypothetical protein